MNKVKMETTGRRILKFLSNLDLDLAFGKSGECARLAKDDDGLTIGYSGKLNTTTASFKNSKVMINSSPTPRDQSE